MIVSPAPSDLPPPDAVSRALDGRPTSWPAAPELGLLRLSGALFGARNWPDASALAWDHLRLMLPLRALALCQREDESGQDEWLFHLQSASPDDAPSHETLTTLANAALRSNDAPGNDAGAALSDDGAGALLLFFEPSFGDGDFALHWARLAGATLAPALAALKRAQAAQRELESERAAGARLRALVEGVSAVLWEADAVTLRPTFVSPQAAQWLGYAPAAWECGPRFWGRLAHPSDRRRLFAQVKANAGNAAPWQFEFRALTHEGRELWLWGLVTPETRDGRLIRARVLTLDVTQRQRQLDALLESNAILGATQEASADGICLIDEHGQIRSFNRSFARLWQIAPGSEDGDAVLSQVLAAMSHPDEWIESMSALRQNPAASSRDEVALRDGRTFERTSALARARNGRSFGRVWTFGDITQRKHCEEKLAHQAYHDVLTRLPNRALFIDRLRQALGRLDRRGKALAVLFLDLDRFKSINDTLGHEKGDFLLQEVARRLESSLRPGDTAARFGGDEFTLLLEDVDGANDAGAITERLIEALQAPFELDGSDLPITTSVGIALSFSAKEGAEDLLRGADIALYRAKNKGRARYEIFRAPQTDAARHALQLEVELRQALKRGQLRLAYQPILNLQTERVVGAEALVRWQHPTRGTLAPGEFLGVAEESGLILPIGTWVMREACAQARRWQMQFGRETPFQISINLSARQFHSRELATQLAAVLEETALPAACLELDIAGEVVRDDATTARTLGELKKLGVRLAIHDFGAAPTARLANWPLDALKLDRSLLDGRDSSHQLLRDGRVLLKRAQTLTHGRDLALAAQGVETFEQLAALRDLGCAVGQGYFWAEPLASGALSDWMEEKR